MSVDHSISNNIYVCVCVYIYILYYLSKQRKFGDYLERHGRRQHVVENYSGGGGWCPLRHRVRTRDTVIHRSLSSFMVLLLCPSRLSVSRNESDRTSYVDVAMTNYYWILGID